MVYDFGNVRGAARRGFSYMAVLHSRSSPELRRINGYRLDDRIGERFRDTVVAPIVLMEHIAVEIADHLIERHVGDRVPVFHDLESIEDGDIRFLRRGRDQFQHPLGCYLCLLRQQRRRVLRVHDDDVGGTCGKATESLENGGLDVIQEVVLPRRVGALPNDERRAPTEYVVLEPRGLVRRFLAPDAQIEYADRRLQEANRQGRT
jgi:hypothetical protein